MCKRLQAPHKRKFKGTLSLWGQDSELEAKRGKNLGSNMDTNNEKTKRSSKGSKEKSEVPAGNYGGTDTGGPESRKHRLSGSARRRLKRAQSTRKVKPPTKVTFERQNWGPASSRTHKRHWSNGRTPSDEPLIMDACERTNWRPGPWQRSNGSTPSDQLDILERTNRGPSPSGTLERHWPDDNTPSDQLPIINTLERTNWEPIPSETHRQHWSDDSTPSDQPPTENTLERTNWRPTPSETTKQQWWECKTPNDQPPKKIKEVITKAVSFKDEFKMAIAHLDLDISLTEEETGRIKDWILEKIDTAAAGSIHPKFTDCRHCDGSLRITCCDQATKYWLSGLLQYETPLEGDVLQLIEVNLLRPVRAIVHVPGPVMEPEKLFKRLQLQNEGLETNNWRVLNSKEDSRGQQLVVLMDRTSWESMEAYGHKPYVNFTRIQFKRQDIAEENEKMGVEGTLENPVPFNHIN